MLIGQDRAGKTSLKKSLLSLPFNPKEQSTEGIEIDPSKFDVDVDQVKNWQRTDEKLDVSYFVKDLARMVAGELQEIKETYMDSELQNKSKEIRSKRSQFSSLLRSIKEKVKRSKTTDRQMDTKSQDESNNIESQNKQIGEEKNVKTQEAPVSHHSESITGESHSESITGQPRIPELKIDAALPSEEFTDHLVVYLKSLKLQTEAATVEHHMTLDLWDFAGQHVYYASYPVFLSLRAVYMLVYNLSKGLKNIAQPCVRQGVHEILLRNPNNETNLENFLSWLATVRTTCSTKSEMDESKATTNDLPHLRPPIFIVGTHADEPYQDIKEMESQIQREISEKDYELHVIRPFFSVDNTQGSSGEGVAALKKRMIEVLKEEPYMGKEVPLRWFNFEKVVQALTAEKVFYLNLEQLQSIIQKVCFIEDENEAATVLDFYHDLGMIVKHRNTVVLRAQWLIDLFKQLITIRSFNDMEPRHSKLWKEMETTGVLNMELVDHVFAKFCQQGLIKDDILNMMERFGLIVKFATSPTNEMYFVPCQLKTPPEPLCKTKPSPSDPCPLYLHFLGGFVPYGLFSQLVSRCTRWCSTSGFKQPPNLFDGAARFFIVKELIHQLILICKKRFVKIVLKQMEQERNAPLAAVAKVEEVAILVRRFLEDTMQNLSHELPWLKNVTYELCVECPYCREEETSCRNHGEVSCTHEDCMCLLQVPPGGLLSYCPNSLCNTIMRLPQLEKWYSIEEMPRVEVNTSPESKRGSSCSTAQLPEGVYHPVGQIFYAIQQIEHSAAGKATSKTDLSLELKRIASDKGFTISDNQGGGNCMFHALSEQLDLVKGMKISHEELRQTVVLNLKSNPKLSDGTELFNFVHGYSSWDSYLTNMAKAGTWGDHLILHGVANYFGTSIHVISSLSHQHDLIISPGRDIADSNRLVLGHIHEHHYASLRPKQAVRPGHHPGTDDVYNMTALPRGITLIINNKLFKDHPEHRKPPTRDGSEEDVREVAELFHALGFDVHTKENLSRLQLLNELDSVACQDHSDYDCFVLWLMSHGKNGVVFCSDGVQLPIQSAQDMLSNCKTLRDKPKLFFIQACRGDEEDEGFAIMTDRPPRIQDPPVHVVPPSDVDVSSASRISPTHADFLYSYATVEGYVSYRHKALGSYYVRALVEVFRERATRDDLVGILTTVNRKVSEMEMSDVKTFKQMPEYKSTLLKKLRF